MKMKIQSKKLVKFLSSTVVNTKKIKGGDDGADAEIIITEDVYVG